MVAMFAEGGEFVDQTLAAVPELRVAADSFRMPETYLARSVNDVCLYSIGSYESDVAGRRVHVGLKTPVISTRFIR